MASWQRCDRCRRVLPGEEFDEGSTTCRACLTVPVKAPAERSKASAVTRSRTAPRPAAAAAPSAPGPRAALRGVTGSGDLEVRERRARRAALEGLAESHPEEFALLLRDARAVEGLRPAGNTAEPRPEAAGPQPGDDAAPDASAAGGDGSA